jgi:hypothetical protein
MFAADYRGYKSNGITPTLEKLLIDALRNLAHIETLDRLSPPALASLK